MQFFIQYDMKNQNDNPAYNYAYLVWPIYNKKTNTRPKNADLMSLLLSVKNIGKE